MPRRPSLRRGNGNGQAPATARSDSDRLANIEAQITIIQGTLDVQFKRIAAIQAEVDHLTAKKRDL